MQADLTTLAIDTQMVTELLRGLVTTLEVTLVSAAGALVIAFGVGIGRTVGPRWARAALRAYVEVFRGTSALIQLFYCYFVLPFLGLPIPAFAAACLALALNSGAYGSIIVSSAIDAVDRGQTEAAQALHLNPRQASRFVLVPQAIRRMLPPFGNLLVEHLKMTSLVSLVTVTDLTFRAQAMIQQSGHAGLIYALTLALYFAVCYPLSRLTRRLERGVGQGA